VACDRRGAVLNLVAGDTDRHRGAIAALSRENPERVLREMKSMVHESLPLFAGSTPSKKAELRLPARHTLTVRDLRPEALKKVLLQTYERQSSDFEHLLGQPGIGAQSLRSLSLIAEVTYNAPASRRDPAAYSFAHGGKDGHPYRVNRPLYDANIERLREALRCAKIGNTDKESALKSLARFTAKLGTA
jgi:hypothetical protein